jgi:hypothetical protein
LSKAVKAGNVNVVAAMLDSGITPDSKLEHQTSRAKNYSFLIFPPECRSLSTTYLIVSHIAGTTAHLKRSCTSPLVSAKLKFGSIYSAMTLFNTFRAGTQLDAGFEAAA